MFLVIKKAGGSYFKKKPKFGMQIITVDKSKDNAPMKHDYSERGKVKDTLSNVIIPQHSLIRKAKGQVPLKCNVTY